MLHGGGTGVSQQKLSVSIVLESQMSELHSQLGWRFPLKTGTPNWLRKFSCPSNY